MKVKKIDLATVYKQFLNHLPLAVVVLVALVIAFQNIDFSTYYSGWDNIHAEFNLARYARQVFFGSWLEHQGLGAPAAQAHLSEIPRLPILFFLQLLLPDNLIRYTYIFSMYLVGGVGVYLFLSKIWLNKKTGNFKNWIASLGAVFYLLHILTLQQYYISFEMFMVQFAFFPFLLMLIHKLSRSFSSKHILLFILLQFLIAPSGHTPTVFYLAVLLSMIYGFFVHLKNNFKINWRSGLAFSFLIGLLTLITNAYWILPNLYYSVQNSHYVQESRTNSIFAPESVWSIKEAGTFQNFVNNTHYLFNWKDYSFSDQKFEYVFHEWLPHLNSPLTQTLMAVVGFGTLVGLALVIWNKNKGYERWAFVIFYLFSVFLIWINLFPTNVLVNYLYRFGVFQEAFRNPFTKLSILFSFVSVVFFVEFAEFIIDYFQQHKSKAIFQKLASVIALLFLFFSVIYIALPSFQGHFINDKLRIKYPDQYFELFDYLKTRDSSLRVLPLPQFNHAAWVYHDWSFIEPGNGYQGMGFNFFGIPQPVLKRDFDRWGETNDFFYHELKYALDTNDVTHFSQLLAKYNIDLVLVDETKIDPFRDYDYQKEHQLLVAAGLNKVWERDFLSIYQKDEFNKGQFFVPQSIKIVSANTDRIKKDWAYHHEGDYISSDLDKAVVIYPFTDLMQPELVDVNYAQDFIKIRQEIELGNYLFTLPGAQEPEHLTPVMIDYSGQRVKVRFPVNRILVKDEVITLPHLPHFQFYIDEASEIIVFFNNQGIVIQPGQIIYPVLSVDVGQPISIAYANRNADLNLIGEGRIRSTDLEIKKQFDLNPDWNKFKNDLVFQVDEVEELILKTEFPVVSLDVAQNPSVNCSDPEQGFITADFSQGIMTYEADKYAVSCNGYNFDYMSSAASYLLNVSGENIKGRSIKFFVSNSQEGVMPDDYMLPQGKYDSTITLNKVSDDPRAQYFLNWETRSFGKLSKNQIYQMRIVPFPFERLAQLRMETVNSADIKSNNIAIKQAWTFIDAIHIIDLECEDGNCYLGTDQSYDDLWLAFRLGETKLLPHFKFNNWANLWQVDQSGRIIILYLPEAMALFSFVFLAAATTILGYKVTLTSIKKDR